MTPTTYSEGGVARSINGAVLPDVPDLARMRTERHARLQAQMASAGVDALLLLGTNPVAYATGAEAAGADSGRAGLMRPVALVVGGDPQAHLFTPYPDGAPAELAEDHLHPAIYPDLSDGAAAAAAAVSELVPSGCRLAVDELPHPLAGAFGSYEITGASGLMGPARLVKTPDELACIRTAQHINELAMARVQPQLRPGVRQNDLSAWFLEAIFDLGATGNGIDPIWQVMPDRLADGPWTTHGDVAFPTASTDRILRAGDVVWVDTGIDWHGYASDFGRTWLVDPLAAPTGRQAGQFRRWDEVVAAVLAILKPGVTALELGRAAIDANGGVRPWMEHFYLAHGLGTESAEMPMIGTDLGDAFDDRLVMAPGMVLVLEPVIWDEGEGGYRSEDIFAVTDDGWVALSDHPYDPYGSRSW
ncbi:MAG: M24 family metallopeptidase [Acidimicrobiales bacterium]